ncbi:DcaP family trimeric outer membrane transporter [Marinilabilia sp.]|uniref:DcaP family trimeric outer membrane transporter n=1 Tax=Marinilabilia sp. TaxID=2021252 RepID=UPI0025C3F165|nr:DcaP family trimeric outer membrane transporter [Marinilabilia sp.]
MKTIFLFVVLAMLILWSAKAQDFKFDFHGYVGVDAAANSRASVEARNRHIYLYPLPELLTETGEDENDRSQFDLDAAHSRVGMHISGPALKGFKTSAVLEGDFLGNGNGDNNFRLRHAFVKFSREKWSVTAGQTWHPLFLTENFPGTVNVNAGSPFHPLIRSPQIRFTWQVAEQTQLQFFIVEQNNFRSTGFANSSTELSGMPELDVQMKWAGKGAWAAFTAGYKTLAVPGSFTEGASVEKVPGYHFNGSFRYQFPSFTFRMEGIYGSNLSEMVMLGGVGQSIADNDFVALETGSIWTDIQGNNTDGFQPGIFAGYTANMGSAEEVVVVSELSRSKGQVASVFAVSPRVKYLMGKAWVGLEYLLTSASWGNNFDNYGVPTDTDDYINHRVLLSLRYNF